MAVLRLLLVSPLHVDVHHQTVGGVGSNVRLWVWRSGCCGIRRCFRRGCRTPKRRRWRAEAGQWHGCEEINNDRVQQHLGATTLTHRDTTGAVTSLLLRRPFRDISRGAAADSPDVDQDPAGKVGSDASVRVDPARELDDMDPGGEHSVRGTVQYCNASNKTNTRQHHARRPHQNSTRIKSYETRTNVRSALHANGAAVLLDDGFGDGQAQAGGMRFAGAVADLTERQKQLFLVGSGNARPGVHHRKRHRHRVVGVGVNDG